MSLKAGNIIATTALALMPFIQLFGQNKADTLRLSDELIPLPGVAAKIKQSTGSKQKHPSFIITYKDNKRGLSLSGIDNGNGVVDYTDIKSFSYSSDPDREINDPAVTGTRQPDGTFNISKNNIDRFGRGAEKPSTALFSTKDELKQNYLPGFVKGDGEPTDFEKSLIEATKQFLKKTERKSSP